VVVAPERRVKEHFEHFDTHLKMDSGGTEAASANLLRSESITTPKVCVELYVGFLEVFYIGCRMSWLRTVLNECLATLFVCTAS
jgi:hypothetical protein